ncbi:unnamed protein product [Pelagomonas calceolata]|uniref:D,D-heptose 1,7-bisphosphate phosphatase n=1 Tax=Pelagomonas calceolata TaxID=35677 RepID=A0A7S4A414_9STRA|nr:unnamed protein product [Pelagomonas calceolata]
MGPAHRRADSRRSARKNSGYTPWHLLPAAAREAKRKRPSRTPAKKRRAPPAPARSPSPTRRQPLHPVVALLAALAGAALLLDAARRVLLLVGVSAAAPAQRSPCNRICRRNPSFMDGTVCIGCFLADDEVRGWSSFNARERGWALADAAERRSEWEQYTGVTASDAEDDYGGFDATTDGADATDAYGGFEQTDAVPRPWTVLLDRDGVLNKDVGSPGVVRAEQFELLPGVSDAVRALKEDGHACVVVTNQNARKKGLLSAKTLDKLHASLRREVPVDDIFVATGLDGPALKPAPDLLNLALGDADRDRAVLVGDARTDMIAACRAGILAVLVTSSHHGVACAAELAEAPTPAVIDGGAPGGLLREGASVAAVFPALPQALAAIRAHASSLT